MNLGPLSPHIYIKLKRERVRVRREWFLTPRHEDANNSPCIFRIEIRCHREIILFQSVLEREMVGPGRPQFVLFGSSIVQLSFSNGGWGAILADLYSRKADIVLRGYSGWNSRRAIQVLDEVFPKDAALQPSLVIVYFGGNDSVQPHPSGLGTHVPLPEYVENMRKIAIHLKGLNEKTRVIFLTAPPINEDQIREFFSDWGPLARKNELCGEYSKACIKLCKEMDIKGIDLWTAIQRRKDWRNTCFVDGIHFTAEASKVVVKEILKVLRQKDWEPSLHYESLSAEFGEDSPYDPVSSDGKATVNVSEFSIDRIIHCGIHDEKD